MVEIGLSYTPRFHQATPIGVPLPPTVPLNSGGQLRPPLRFIGQGRNRGYFLKEKMTNIKTK